MGGLAAGAEQTVIEALAVSLSGDQSSDPDGVISAYDWTQTAGPVVSLSGAQTATPTFTAPSVSSNTSLSFELTVTDDVGATASDQTNVLVQPSDGSGDVTAPTTTISVVKNNVQGASHFDVTLTVDEPADTYFRVTGDGTVTAGGSDTTAWQTYTGPVYIENPKKGTTTFDYYSVDPAGNQEATKTEVLQ